MNGSRITPKQVEAYVPPLSRVLGMGEAKTALQIRAQRWKMEDEPNTLITGKPGQGARTLILSFLAQRLGPQYRHPRNDFWYHLESPYQFVWIDGGSVTDKFLEELVGTALAEITTHTVVLVEHLDQLFLRGMEGGLFSMLAASRVTTYATAHTFRDERQQLSYTFPEVVSHLADFLRRPLIKVNIRCRTVWK